MDAANVHVILAAAGFHVGSQMNRIEPRDDRWAVFLPDGRVAWFPMNPAGAQRLAVERRVLRLLGARCSFRVPRVLFVAEAGWELRTLVPGLCDPWGLYRRTRIDRGLAGRIGRAVGRLLAEQHTRISLYDTVGWLPQRLPWPEPPEQVCQKLLSVTQNVSLQTSIQRVLRRYEGLTENEVYERVLVHGDLGFHNMAIDPATDEVQGVFDYDGAAWADRHQDFRFLVFPDGTGEEELDGALEVYESATGLRLDRERIRLCNAACAIGFLAFRCGTPPEALSCGRTLREDLMWVDHALRDVGEA